MRTRRSITTAAIAAVGAAALSVGVGGAPAPAATVKAAPPQAFHVDPWITQRLGGSEPFSVLVHGTDVAHAIAAVKGSGLRVGAEFPEYGTVATVGSPSAIRTLATKPGLTYLEGDKPLAYTLDSSHIATRGQQAIDGLATASGTTSFDGTGVSIAVIDSGVDPGHPFFKLPGGGSKVVVNRKTICGISTGIANIFDPGVEEQTADNCFVDAGSASTDDASAGGHGTHVNGIAAGVNVDAISDTNKAIIKHLHGAAPGAKLVSLSAGTALSIQGATTGFYWVKRHHADPCGNGSCPPIKVVSNSYGSAGGSEFDPNGLYTQIQRDLVSAGIVVVWAAGNDGDQGKSATDGSNANATNGPAQDPTPGVIQVANYDDRNSGTRDNALDTSSSRGRVGEPNTYPDISAPGANITSSCRPELPVCSSGLEPYSSGNYNTISGTSMATPHIAGIVAQLFQAKPTATPAEIELAIVDTAHHFGATKIDSVNYPDVDTRNLASRTKTSFDKGHGLVDVVAAIGALRADIIDPGVANVCPPDGSFTDVRGDATEATFSQTAGAAPNERSLDIVTAAVSRETSVFANAASGDLVYRTTVADMVDAAPAGSTGRYFRMAFKVGTTTYTAIVAQNYVAGSATATAPLTASLSRLLTGTTSTATTIMSSTLADTPANANARQVRASISSATDIIEVRFSIGAFNAIEAATPTITAAMLGDASILSGLAVLSQRQEQAATLTADEAAGPCAFSLGGVASAVVPEVPFAVLLPLAVLGLAVGAAGLTRRRQSSQA